ncbi:MAG: PQQ-dependent sugar dehydrogenase [Terriglobales bacterium]
MNVRRMTTAVLLAWMATLAMAQQGRNRAEVFSDYRAQRPGAVHKITLADLPPPGSTESSDNSPRMVRRPREAWPQAPAGFKVELYADELDHPRLIRMAPNGDVFVAESQAGRVTVFHGIASNGKPQQKEVFARGLNRPFGIAFYPPGQNPEWIYIGNTDAVVRVPYHNGDLKSRAAAQTIAKLPSGAGHLVSGGHWTRDIAFSPDGKKMFVSVGSYSNDDDADNNSREHNRADILEFNPDGTGERVYAYGLRNAVGLAIQPGSGQLWASVNERDELGDNLPPDYITHVEPGGFYGWPWFYTGGHQDPRHAGKHPELKSKVITPDVLLQPHIASLEMTFYEGEQFPSEYRGNIFAAEHGSWNRSKRVGYEVIRVLVKNGRATGEYEDFVTGFVTPEGQVWGRPVGVAVAKDGSLLISDDGSNSIWRVTYTK